MFLSGHSGALLSVSWSPNGYHVATGSDDNTVKVWDLRGRNCVYTIPAHNSLVSRVTFDSLSGQYLVTSSYDGTTKLWLDGSYQLLKSLEGHGQKVMCNSVSSQGTYIATCSYDRTFKLWCPE